ncbi:hypothetical protein F4777DRAFT_502595 [Nemania sp. FL0916]|nr:hypothetical protein F4777DRAFT_502595 [Nemania sp. FL0916]
MSTPPPPNPLPVDSAKRVPPIPVPTHGPGGVFSIACSTHITSPTSTSTTSNTTGNNSALTTLATVLNVAQYGTWNGFVPRARITSPAPADKLEQVQGHIPPELRSLADKYGIIPGAKLRFDAIMVPGGSSRAVDIEVTVLEAFAVDSPNPSSTSTGDGGRKRQGYRIAWKALGFPGFLLRSERVQEFIESADGDGECEYRCWETFSGVLAYVLPVAQLEDGFRRWMGGLKGAVEGTAKAASGE